MNNKKQTEPESTHKMSNAKTLELAKEATKRFMQRENYQELMMTPDRQPSVWDTRRAK
tara:strand:- start:1330 stop:1503 length:174 start_codon:yes stop_codon:yes gene_type:complete